MCVVFGKFLSIQRRKGEILGCYFHMVLINTKRRAYGDFTRKRCQLSYDQKDLIIITSSLLPERESALTKEIGMTLLAALFLVFVH